MGCGLSSHKVHALCSRSPIYHQVIESRRVRDLSNSCKIILANGSRPENPVSGRTWKPVNSRELPFDHLACQGLQCLAAAVGEGVMLEEIIRALGLWLSCGARKWGVSLHHITCTLSALSISCLILIKYSSEKIGGIFILKGTHAWIMSSTF